MAKLPKHRIPWITERERTVFERRLDLMNGFPIDQIKSGYLLHAQFLEFMELWKAANQ